AATLARADHPYLERKRIAPVPTLREITADAAAAILNYQPKSRGEPLTGRLLVVPAKRGDGLSTLELIDETGRKTALAGRGTKAGAYWATWRIQEGCGMVLIGEGVATALSASMAAGHPGIAALSSGNLTAVARDIRERLPGAVLVILADLVKGTGEPDPHAIEAARAVGGLLAVPDFGPDRKPGHTDFNDLALVHGPEAVRRCLANATAPVGECQPCEGIIAPEASGRPEPAGLAKGDGLPTHDMEGKPRPQSAVLIDIGKQHGLFRDGGGDAYAKVRVGNRIAVMAIGGSEHRETLGREFFAATGKGANRNAVGDAVATLSAIARYEGTSEAVFLRVADAAHGVEIDLGDGTGDAAIVTPVGWRVGTPSVNFRRSGKPLGLPRPTAADFAKIWRHVNVEPEDRPLLAAWLLAALRPRGPYPIALLIGEQGTGKSATSRVLKRLTDPSAVMLRPPPREDRDLQVAAVSSWCVALDNLSGLNPQLSDCLCRLSTGGGFAGRKLYSDTDETLLEIQRPLIVNGIDDIASRPDLSDRCLHLLLPPLTTRKTESDMDRAFAADAPGIFAALLDGLALAVKDHASVRLAKPPRMADFAVWAAAGLPALGFTAEEFMTAYSRNREHLAELAVEASPVASTLVTFMATRDNWTGSSVELLDRLADTSPGAAGSQFWPRSAKGLLGALRRVAPALRAAGITVDHSRTEHARTVTVCKGRFEASDVSDVSARQQYQRLESEPQSVRTCQPKHPNVSDVSDVSAETRTNDASDTYDTLKPTLHGGLVPAPVTCPKCGGEGCRWCARVSP
ncbi:MAG: toprim domain-containing protein, partial [Porticoccaceae bacterium]